MLDPSAFFLSSGVAMNDVVPDNLIGAYENVLAAAAQAAPDWIPDMTGYVDGIFRFTNPPQAPRLSPAPAGLTSDQQAAWSQFYAQLQPVGDAIIQGALDQAAAQAASIDTTLAYLDVAYRVTADVATLGVNEAWIAFWNEMAACKADSDATTVALSTAASSLAKQGANAAPSDVQNQQALQAQQSSLVMQIINTIAPLGSDVRAQAGLGSPMLVVAGIAAAVVVTITASVAALGAELSSVQKQANTHAQSVIDHETALNDTLLAQGKITPAQHQANTLALVQAGNTIAQNQGAGAIGGALGQAGTGLAIGLGVLGIGALLFFWGKKKIQTNPRRR